MYQVREQQVSNSEVRFQFIEETQILFAAQPQNFCVTLRGSHLLNWALALYWQVEYLLPDRVVQGWIRAVSGGLLEIMVKKANRERETVKWYRNLHWDEAVSKTASSFT